MEKPSAQFEGLTYLGEGFIVKGSTMGKDLNESDFDRLDLSMNGGSLYAKSSRRYGSKAMAVSSSGLPTEYSSIEYLPPVRNQGPYGVCWAFSLCGMAEVDIVKNHGGDKEQFNLSELAAAYFMYMDASQELSDPLKNTLGDYNYDKSGPFQSGAYEYQGVYMTSAGIGLIQERIGENTNYESMESVQESMGEDGSYDLVDKQLAWGHNDCVLREAYFFDFKDDAEAIKQSIMEYGAARVTINVKDDYNHQYLNEETHDLTQYYYNYNISDGLPHSVLIVGWNDDIPNEYFDSYTSGVADGNAPTNNGAWLVRNSWGTKTFDQNDGDLSGENANWDGYFWLSYEDESARQVNVCDFEPTDNEEHYYVYDTSLYNASFDLEKNQSVGNIFQVKQAGEEDAQQLTDVIITTGSTDSRFEIRVYANESAMESPRDGELMQPEITFTTPAVGVYRISLDEGIVLKPGQYFSVVLTNVSDDTKKVMLESNSIVSEDESYINGSAKEGQSFYMAGEGDAETWYDFYDCEGGDDPYTLRLKVLSKDVNYPKVDNTDPQPNNSENKPNSSVNRGNSDYGNSSADTGRAERKRTDSAKQTGTAGNWHASGSAGGVSTWKYFLKDANRYASNEWVKINYGQGTAWYRFDPQGNMMTGWYTDSASGRTYHMSEKADGSIGVMSTGWYQDPQGKYYFFDPVEGSLLKNTVTPDGYLVNADGLWTGASTGKNANGRTFVKLELQDNPSTGYVWSKNISDESIVVMKGESSADAAGNPFVASNQKTGAESKLISSFETTGKVGKADIVMTRKRSWEKNAIQSIHIEVETKKDGSTTVALK